MSIELFSKPLFVAAHTDDIELFAGGTVARFSHLARMATFSQHAGCHISPTEEAFAAAGWMGIAKSQLYIGTLPACQPPPKSFFDMREEIAEVLRQIKEEWSPSIVITHQSTDTNQDHRLIHDEVKRVFKHVPIICGRFASNDFPPATRQMFVVLTQEQVQAKIAALSAYRSQHLGHRRYFDPDMIQAEAQFFGDMIGVAFAEAFEVIRLWI